LCGALFCPSLQTLSPDCSAHSTTQNATPQKPLCGALSFLSLQTSSPDCSAHSTTQNSTPQKTLVLDETETIIITIFRAYTTEISFVMRYSEWLILFNKRYGNDACLHRQALNNYHRLAGQVNSC
jgi:hypothetical protein